MAYSTEFTCPNGHSFTANAKLRARCPECGQMARKFGRSNAKKPESDETPDPTSEPIQEPKPEPKVKATEPEPEPTPEPKKAIKVIRKGRVREQRVMPKQPAKKVVTKARGLITHKKVTRRAIPQVRVKPRSNREHKVSEPGKDRPYWHDVADKYGIG